MTGLVALSLIGVVVALLRGGSLSGWTRVQVSWSLVALASLGLQLVLHNAPIDRQPWAITYGPLVWMACLAGLLAMLVRNCVANPATRAAWAVAAVGVGLNLLVVASNGGYMPQSADARATVHGLLTEQAEPRLRNIVTLDDESRLGFLGDVIAQPAWLPNANVISLGDLLLGAGLAWWAFLVTAGRPPGWWAGWPRRPTWAGSPYPLAMSSRVRRNGSPDPARQQSSIL
jgi:hypothetical protein